MLKKKILKTIYNLRGFAPFHWASRDNVLILTYHRFSEEKHPFKISSEEFATHLEYLKKNNHVLSLNEIVKSLEKDEKLPPNSVAITIDDGYADAYEIAFPVLKSFDFHATLFAITDFVEGKIWLWTDKMRYVLLETKNDFLRVEFGNYDTIEKDLTDEIQRLKLADKVNSILKKLPNEEKESKILEIAESLNVEIPETPTAEFAALTWEMAREMDAGNLKIESHTVTHPILTNIDEKQLDFELQISKERLENHLEKSVETFCYPNGAFDEKVRQAVEKADYKCAVTTRYGFVKTVENKFLLNRIDAQNDIVDFAQSVSGFEAVKEKLRN
jgi:peptidoglycan/xylan/chitin deacetylase (PgdA/CDA1 family)